MNPIVTALIDADILAYQAATASEQPIRWDDDLWTLHAFESEAEAKFDAMIDNLIEKVDAKNVILAFSDSKNWRKEILPTYKHNRSDVRKPILLKHLREYAKEKYNCYQREGLEGDDCLGILATMKSKVPDSQFIVCSIDKDFKTIPGHHYNFGRDELFAITEHEADKWHMYQTLTGDSTDGYGGCPGVGPKTAEKILQAAIDEGTPWANRDQLNAILWAHVVKAYEKAGLSAEEALVQARVARICRASDYDFANKQVKLWEPYEHNE
jgi:DNA polymerase-1